MTSRTSGTVLIKRTPSKCNKQLLEYLSINSNKIKRHMILKVEYADGKLDSLKKANVKCLPVLIINGKIIETKSGIIQNINNFITDGSKIAKKINNKTSEDLMDFWNDEMHNGIDKEEYTNSSPNMDEVVRRAMNASQVRKNSIPKRKKREHIPTTHEDGNIKITDASKISEFVSEDPIMSKFWENQEESP